MTTAISSFKDADIDKLNAVVYAGKWKLTERGKRSRSDAPPSGHNKSLSANSPHTSCLHIFRQTGLKFPDRRQPACKILTLFDEKSDGAICAHPICG
ncbi:MAG: hypothetical protein HDT14_04710 [Oscillibacter sp.]|nr:hypothetical protein [Oscillibacter sp.]